MLDLLFTVLSVWNSTPDAFEHYDLCNIKVFEVC